MKLGTVLYKALVQYGAWGRHGRILQSGLHASVVNDEIILEAVTSKGMVSDAARLRIPLAHKNDVIELLKDLD